MTRPSAVGDAGPLHYLILIEEAHLLGKLFEKVFVPTTVRDELSHPNTPLKVKEAFRDPSSWLEIVALSATPHKLRGLDLGESATLYLAAELKMDTILMDDFAGRRVAHALDFNPIGTLSILEQAAINSLVDLPSAISKLRATNFYVTEELLDQALLRDHARRSQQ